VTRWFLRKQWAVVGSGDVPKIETAFVGAFLFGAGEGTDFVDRIEERIDTLLPGQRGLNLVRNAIAEARVMVLAEEGHLPSLDGKGIRQPAPLS
jgi:hypothetical protein